MHLTSGLIALTFASSGFSGVPALDWSDIGALSATTGPLIASITPDLELREHKILKDENDWTISKKYGITVTQLHAANPGLDWRRLQIGQKISLPPGSEPAGPTIRTSRARVSTAAARVRTEPNTSSRVKVTVRRGTMGSVIQNDGNWYKLRFPRGTVGWVRGDLLAEVPEPPEPSDRPEPVVPPAPMHVSEEPVAPVNIEKSTSIVNLALDMRGVRYKWGGTSPRGFDCSGLIVYAYNKQGIRLPRTSAVLSTFGQHVSKDRLQPGDLLFFMTGRSRRVNHVALYIGDGKFVHSSSTRGKVIVSNLSKYGPRYAGARRVPGLQVDAVVPALHLEPETAERIPSRVVVGVDLIGN